MLFGKQASSGRKKSRKSRLDPGRRSLLYGQKREQLFAPSDAKNKTSSLLHPCAGEGVLASALLI